MLKQILFGGESGLSPIANAGLTLLRIFVGVALAFSHGIGKLPPDEQLIQGTASIGFPAPTFFCVGGGTFGVCGRHRSCARTFYAHFELFHRLRNARRASRRSFARPVWQTGIGIFLSIHCRRFSLQRRGRLEH